MDARIVSYVLTVRTVAIVSNAWDARIVSIASNVQTATTASTVKG